MTEELITPGAGLLRDVATAAMTASQAPPLPGSVLATEMELDDDLGDENLPFPYGFAHSVQRTLVYAAGERLVTLSWCVEADPSPHVMSASELARAAAEAASTAFWLGEQVADGERRLRRLLGLLAISDAEETGLRRTLRLDLDDPQADGTRRALKWGSDRGMKHERPGNRTDLLVHSSPDAGDADYRRLSAVAHSTLYAVLGTWTEVVAAQGGNLDPIRLHALISSIAAARYALSAVRSATRTSGRDPDSWASVAGRLDGLETEVVEAGLQVDWQLP